MIQSVKQFEQLLKIMKRLRRECPWDKEQTPESLRRFVLEEAYEVVDTIDRKDWQELSEELGDLLLQIVFQSEIAEENKFFTLSTVIEGINQKLIERHPHVFNSTKVNSAREVEQNWERIKLKTSTEIHFWQESRNLPRHFSEPSGFRKKPAGWALTGNNPKRYWIK